LAIDPVVAIRAAAMDLPGFGDDKSHTMQRQQFADVIVNQQLPFALHPSF
jgi:hypothetical protein